MNRGDVRADFQRRGNTMKPLVPNNTHTNVGRKTNKFALGFKSLLTAGIFFAFAQMAAAETQYTITTVTGKKGTNADIVVKLHGTEGSLQTWSPPLDNPGVDDMEPGQTNRFVISDQFDIGFITDVEIKGLGLGLNVDPWDMESMTISTNGPKSKGKTTRFTYSRRIDQDDINRDYPVHKALLLRANNLDSPQFQFSEREVTVGETWKAYGGLSGLGDNREITFSRNDIIQSEAQTKDSLGTKNTLELEVSGDIPLTSASARSLYRLEVETQHEKLRKFTSSTSRGKTEKVTIAVPPKTMEFIKVVYKERLKLGTFENPIETHSRYVVLEEIITTPVRVVFNYVDEVKDGYSFVDLYKKAFPNQPVPTGPLKNPTSQAVATAVAAAPTPSAPSPVPTGEPVTGLNAVSVIFNGGSFKQIGDKQWAELDSSGTARFNFTEAGRDDWTIYLNEIGSSKKIQLNLWRKKVRYGTDTVEMQDLYPITGSQ